MSYKVFTATTLALAIAAGAAHAERAGRVTAAQPQAYQAEGAIGFEIGTNSEIFRHARVYTKQYGTVEIKLEDGTQLTVAPNASLVIDDYVFAGTQRPGSLALSLSRGAVRMISGRMPKDGVALSTPIATIGVRGTTIWVSATSEEQTQVWVTEGAGMITLAANGQAYELTAPAHAICSAQSCVTGAPPPVPVINPLGGGNDRGGDPGVDRDIDHGEDSESSEGV